MRIVTAEQRIIAFFFPPGSTCVKIFTLILSIFLESLWNWCVLRHKGRKREVNSLYGMSAAGSPYFPEGDN